VSDLIVDDPEQFVFELYGVMYAIYHESRLLHRPGAIERAMRCLDRVIDFYCATTA